MAVGVGFFTDGSGAIASGGTAEDALGVDGGRSYLLVQNIDDDQDLWVAFGEDAVEDECFRLVAGASIEFASSSTGVVPTGRVSVLGATTGNKYIAKAA